MHSEQGLDDSTVDELAKILMALADVAAGDYTTRIATDLESDHPLAVLGEGVNGMVESLEDVRKRSLEYQTELEEKLKLIEAQSRAIRELSTPAIEVWEGVLCLPI